MSRTSMTLGILTLQAQLNYGGVLQCWALQKALERMGYKVRVLDVWLDPECRRVKGPFAGYPLRTWRHFLMQALLGTGDGARLVRCWRTMCFLARRIHLTPYHFCRWSEAPRELGVDALVVGSDQVWHCGDWGDPRPFLLEDAPVLPAISYAASFGFSEWPETARGLARRRGRRTFPLDVVALYRRGLARFAALSCREAEGVALCRTLGFAATHVVDPVLLLEPEEWRRSTRRRLSWALDVVRRLVGRKGRTKIVCYFLSQPLRELRPLLMRVARERGWRFEVFVDRHFDPPAQSPGEWCRRVGRRIFGPVKERLAAGPLEFARAMAEADGVVTDSFHALMFAGVNDVNVRVVAPTGDLRQRMFSRIAECRAFIQGDFVLPTTEAALTSLAAKRLLFDQTQIARRRRASHEFLASSLANLTRSANGVDALPRVVRP